LVRDRCHVTAVAGRTLIWSSATSASSAPSAEDTQQDILNISA
jgi:hypothetical protein